MAGTDKQSAYELFSKISAYSTIVQQNLGKYLNKLSPYAKEYESSLDLVLDILRTLGYSEERLVAELLEVVTGDANVGSIVESGYHGLLNTLESKIAILENKEDVNDGFITRLENSVKVTISSILTSILTCSVSPFIPKKSLDIYYEKFKGTVNTRPINIPTRILDFSNTLHVSPVSESGVYFYNTNTVNKYYRRSDGIVEPSGQTIADIRDSNSERIVTYTYSNIEFNELTEDERKSIKKVVSVPKSVTIRQGEKKPPIAIYTARPNYTAEGLYKTFDMNAFIWYVANRGDNTELNGTAHQFVNPVYEYNKMAWDSRRMNAMGSKDESRSDLDNPDRWDYWLKSRETKDGKLFLKINEDDEPVSTLFPILQLEPSEYFGHSEHIIATFPYQTYLTYKKVKKKDPDSGELKDIDVAVTKTIYKFNADYLRSIKIFNWKTIMLNLLYELNGTCPIPDIQFNLSLSDEIIDARLSTLILNTIYADDKETDDSYYVFSNEDYSEALKTMELRKYSAKKYDTAASTAIQNQGELPLGLMDSVSTAATLNEITSKVMRGVYEVNGTSGSTGITKTSLSFNLAMESNFVYELLFAIVKPFVRAILSPQIMLLFCINLDVMGLVNLKDIGDNDADAVADFIFRKLSGILKKLIIQIKNEIVLYLFNIAREAIKKLVNQIATIILLEQLNDYIRLLNQIMECLRNGKFSIGKTVSGIDEVNYADIIPEAKTPKTN